MMHMQNWQGYIKITTCTVVIGLLSGCATISPGLQSGELPPVGMFAADNGMTFNVQPLSYATLPPVISSGSTIDSKADVSRIRQLVQSSKAMDYRISAGDILSINLVSYPEVTPSTATNSSSNNPYAAGYPVDQQGYIQFPLIGRIQAGGMSIIQFTDNLRARLQRYLKYPDPQVKIVNYRGSHFFIDGEIRQSGEFSIADVPVSLYSALSMAGGTTPNGDSNNIELNRGGERYHLGLRALRDMGYSANNIYLRDGDSIHINSQDRNKVYVLGEFGQVEPVDIPEQGLTLAHVLGQSKGLNSMTADAAKIYVVRDYQGTYADNSHTNIYYVNLQQVTNLALANRFEMQPNDIVYVDPTGLTRWSRFINSILPSTSAIRQLATL